MPVDNNDSDECDDDSDWEQDSAVTDGMPNESFCCECHMMCTASLLCL